MIVPQFFLFIFPGPLLNLLWPLYYFQVTLFIILFISSIIMYFINAYFRGLELDADLTDALILFIFFFRLPFPRGIKLFTGNFLFI